MPVSITRRALRDLANIDSYIAKDTPQAASRMAVELVAACDRLEQFPELVDQVCVVAPAN